MAKIVNDIPIPVGISRWVVDFLTYRKQRVKMANDCYFEWDIHSRVCIKAQSLDRGFFC